LQFDLATLSRRDVYALLSGAIVPRPIAFVSTISPDGIANLAPFSFFAPISSAPPRVILSVGQRRGRRKDTAANIDATRDFVFNVVTEDIAEKMNAAAADFPPEVDEFAAVGLTAAPSVLVRSPRLADSPVNLECKVLELMSVGVSPDVTDVIVGEVVYVHLRDDLLVEGAVDMERLRPIGRLNGDLYCRTRDIFSMERPK
jgi:flavin reductase (DIM6/NTAB) family NADH-FMN oxidoreductase RutF